MTERHIEFTVQGQTLRGILHEPSDETPRAGCLVFLHGWSGDRLGPHRMFVKTARRLAGAGWMCLRFDFRGRGDSDGETAAASIRGMLADTRAAVDFAAARAGDPAVHLLGICSGGKVAAAAAAEDARIAGLVMWSAEALGPLRSSATGRRKTAFALAAYARKLGRAATWRKILTGRVNTALVHKAVLRHETPDTDEQRWEAGRLERFRTFRGPMLFVYGGADPDTGLAAARYRDFCRRQGLEAAFHEIAEANHSFYSLDWERQVIDLTAVWLGAAAGAGRDTVKSFIKRG